MPNQIDLPKKVYSAHSDFLDNTYRKIVPILWNEKSDLSEVVGLGFRDICCCDKASERSEAFSGDATIKNNLAVAAAYNKACLDTFLTSGIHTDVKISKVLASEAPIVTGNEKGIVEPTIVWNVK